MISKYMEHELEHIIELSQRQIEFFDNIQVEPFPAGFADAVSACIHNIQSSQSLTEEHRATIIRAGEHAHKITKRFVVNFERELTLDVFAMIEKHFGKDLIGFFDHDKSHLSDTLEVVYDDLPFMVERGRFLRETTGRDPDLYVDLARNLDTRTQKIAHMYAHPWRLLTYLAKQKLGIPHEYTEIHLREQLIDVAQVLSMRFGARVLYEPNPSTPLKRSIAILGDDISIHANVGLIWTVIYNNLKNTQRKFTADEERHVKEQPDERVASYEERRQQYIDTLPERVSRAGCYELNRDYVALVFSDTGTPMDLNKMVSCIRVAMHNQDPNTLDWRSPEMLAKFSAWPHNDFAFNTFTTREISSVAFMAHMTGASSPSQYSSGMGLFGTRYIVESLGGALLYTTTFEKENPVFVYILPKEPKDNQRASQRLARGIIKGKVLVPQVA
jgi:hypothetical protein